MLDVLIVLAAGIFNDFRQLRSQLQRLQYPLLGPRLRVHLRIVNRVFVLDVLGSPVEPLSYVPFVDLMRQAYLLITDSGGIQEEGPSLGKPILVLRDKTERPEAVDAGTVKLVGTDPVRILEEASALLDSPELHATMARVHNPYGDGRSSTRISGLIHSLFSQN